MRARDFDREKFMLVDWPEALESGEFEQTKGTLHDNQGYCCLGVACELLSRLRLLPRTHWEGQDLLPEKAARLLGISDEGGFSDTSLAGLNDNDKSFRYIAGAIRKAEKNNKWDDPAAGSRA